ncbi:MAG: nucleotidyltransferase domain-containing protein [Lachnospiraceae bacterium]|nr:nucleotidyltransferase domain-containing protein [Lachnospiraceae bacterium]
MANLSIEEITEYVKQITQRYHVAHLYLFGSYATGTAIATSDIDFIIKGGDSFPAMMEEIENIPTLKKIDIFQYENINNRRL